MGPRRPRQRTPTTPPRMRLLITRNSRLITAACPTTVPLPNIGRSDQFPARGMGGGGARLYMVRLWLITTLPQLLSMTTSPWMLPLLRRHRRLGSLDLAFPLILLMIATRTTIAGHRSSTRTPRISSRNAQSRVKMYRHPPSRPTGTLLGLLIWLI